KVNVSHAAGPFLVTTPDVATTWYGRSWRQVTWSVAGTTAAPVDCANVKIMLSTDGGLTFPAALAASTPNDGEEFVAVPNVTTTKARVRVECATSPFFDISNADFTIVPIERRRPARR
ncbi:MAG: M12 family metallo-peptidase, partial [Thermoanaerobaculia bacterium]